MAVLDPIKLVIDNYPEGQIEYLEVANNLENPELGTRVSSILAARSISSVRTSWKNLQKSTVRLYPGQRSTSDECIFRNLYRI